MKYKLKNVPRRIFLQVLNEDYEIEDEEEKEEEEEEEEYVEEVDFDELRGVTYCGDKIYDYDVEYIRKDLFDNLLKAFKNLKNKIK